MLTTTVITIIIAVLTNLLAPYIFAGLGWVLDWIFTTFSNPFKFVVADGEKNYFRLLLTPELLNVIVKIMISFGVILTVFFVAINLFKVFFSGLSKKVESPVNICVRGLGALFLSYWLIDIIYDIVFPIFQWMLDKVLSINPSSFTVSDTIARLSEFFQPGVVDVNLGTYIPSMDQTSAAVYAPLGCLLVAIILIVFLAKYVIGLFKIISEMAERFLLINVLTVFSPMVASTIVSASTMPIFISWVQMMVANGLVLIFNSLGMIMLNVAFRSFGAMISTLTGAKFTEVIIALIVFNALIKVVQQFDVYLAQLAFKIQAVGGNQKSMPVTAMFALAGKAGKNMENISNAGGLKNYMGAKVGNMLGMVSGNRSGLAGELARGQQEYKATASGYDKAMGSLGKTAFEQSEQGAAAAKAAKQQKDVSKTFSSFTNNPNYSSRMGEPSIPNSLPTNTQNALDYVGSIDDPVKREEARKALFDENGNLRHDTDDPTGSQTVSDYVNSLPKMKDENDESDYSKAQNSFYTDTFKGLDHDEGYYYSHPEELNREIENMQEMYPDLETPHGLDKTFDFSGSSSTTEPASTSESSRSSSSNFNFNSSSDTTKTTSTSDSYHGSESSSSKTASSTSNETTFYENNLNSPKKEPTSTSSQTVSNTNKKKNNKKKTKK